MSPTTDERDGLLRLLRIPDFRRLWVGQSVSEFGDNLTLVSLLFLVQQLVGSPAALAGLAVAMLLPSLVFGLVSGALVDRLDRRSMMITSDIIRGTLVLGLVVVDSASHLWLIYAIAFALAAVGTVFDPAKSALMVPVVGQERPLAANSVSQSSTVVFGLLGTSVAGFAAGFLDPIWPIFVLDALTFWVSAFMIRRVSITSVPPVTEARSVLADVAAGLRAIRQSRTLVGIVLSLAIAMCGLGAVTVLMVPFIVQDLQLSEGWFGLVEGAQVLGMVASAVVVVRLAARLRETTAISLGLVGTGLAVSMISRVDHIWQLMAMLMAVGVCTTPLNAAIETLSQTQVGNEMRGRVGGALDTVVSLATIGSMAVAGAAASTVGSRTVFLAAGLVTVAAGIAAALIMRTTNPTPRPTAGSTNAEQPPGGAHPRPVQMEPA